MEAFVPIASFLAVLAAFLAAGAAWRAARATKDSAEASLIHMAIGEYSEQSMADALRTLVQWKEQNPDDFPYHIIEWKAQFKNGNDAAHKIDRARRKVAMYFHRPVLLRQARLIRSKTFQTMVNVTGLGIYYEIVVPLERALNPESSLETFNFLMKTMGGRTVSNRM